MIRRIRLLAIAVLTAALCESAYAASTHVILCGSGGEVEFQERFTGWGLRLKTVLTDNFRVPRERVHVLMEAPPEGAAIAAASVTPITLEAIETVFAGLRETLTEGDDLFVYLIGHGSYLRRDAKFHIPGPDLTAVRLNELVDGFPVRRLCVLTAASSGAAFINELSGPNRAVASATKSIDEINATEFMEFFIAALEDGSADRNHDERISFLEACEQAAQLTDAWYTNEGLVATEHAILDDNGDGLGARLPLEPALTEAALTEGVFDGELAADVFLLDFSFPPGAPQDMIDTYLAKMDAIKALKQNKASLDEGAYYTELESLLVEAARTNRTIRSFAKPAATDP